MRNEVLLSQLGVALRVDAPSPQPQAGLRPHEARAETPQPVERSIQPGGMVAVDRVCPLQQVAPQRGIVREIAARINGPARPSVTMRSDESEESGEGC